MSSKLAFIRLPPGIYRIVNVCDTRYVLDLSGYDTSSIIAYADHGGGNQRWELGWLGAGYSIRSVHNGAYITLVPGIADGCTLIANDYPVSWALEAISDGLYRIRWPNSTLVVDYLPESLNHSIQLSISDENVRTQQWAFVAVDSFSKISDTSSLQPISFGPKIIMPDPSEPAVTTTDTVIDIEDIKSSGKVSITTTTTTVSTSVTVVKRV